MVQFSPAAIYPDDVAWCIAYLGLQLSSRTEPFAQDVTVRRQAPDEGSGDEWPASGRLVTVRGDGGRTAPFRRFGRLGVNVWAASRADTADLAALVAALLMNSPGSGRVVGVETVTGPIDVPESNTGRHHRYLTAELVFSGSALTA